MVVQISKIDIIANDTFNNFVSLDVHHYIWVDVKLVTCLE